MIDYKALAERIAAMARSYEDRSRLARTTQEHLVSEAHAVYAADLRTVEALLRAKPDWLLSNEALEIGRQAIENELIEWRDDRMFQPTRGNGFVVCEKDGSPSNIIRFGPEEGLRIALEAMLVAAPHLAG